MTELAQILTRLENLENEVKELRSLKSEADKAIEFERLPSTATVGKDYAAFRFGCSINCVLRGAAGTNRIRRVSSKPLKFVKKDVDAAFREYTRPVSEKAADIRAKAKTVRRRQ